MHNFKFISPRYEEESQNVFPQVLLFRLMGGSMGIELFQLKKKKKIWVMLFNYKTLFQNMILGLKSVNVYTGNLCLYYVSSVNQLADLFTKSYSPGHHHCDLLFKPDGFSTILSLRGMLMYIHAQPSVLKSSLLYLYDILLVVHTYCLYDTLMPVYIVCLTGIEIHRLFSFDSFMR